MNKQWLGQTEKMIQDIELERQFIATEYEKLGKELAVKGEELAHWQACLINYKEREQGEKQE